MKQKTKIAGAAGLLLGIGGSLALWAVARREHGMASASVASDHPASAAAPLVENSSQSPKTVRVTEAGMKALGIETVDVKPAPPPEPVRLPGSLLMDPNRLVRIHSRFPGELVTVGTLQTGVAPLPAEAADGAHPAPAGQRPLRYGDKVTKGQIMAVVASSVIGEKKSELVAALVQRDIDNKLLEKYQEVENGGVPERTIQDARRKYEADLVAVAKAERTLRSWRLTEDEMKEIYHEAGRVQKRELNDPHADRTWAETEVRSPINGLIVEKNFNVGDMIDPTQDLFKIADLNHVQVVANAYEEDLPLLRALRPEQRVWRVDIKADPNDVPIPGHFDIVGSIIDPSQHAGAVIGSLDNSDGHLSIGEFITATIDLPADPTLAMVPTTALVDDAGGGTSVYVETNAQTHEFTARKIAIVRRGRERAYVRIQPTAAERAAGAEPLAVGDRVIHPGAAALAAELIRQKLLQAGASHEHLPLSSR